MEKMSITSRVGDLSLSLPEASMGYIWCFLLPLLSRELGCLEHLLAGEAPYSLPQPCR